MTSKLAKAVFTCPENLQWLAEMSEEDRRDLWEELDDKERRRTAFRRGLRDGFTPRLWPQIALGLAAGVCDALGWLSLRNRICDVGGTSGVRWTAFDLAADIPLYIRSMRGKR